MRRDGCRPITFDPDKVIVGPCTRQAGGFRKPGAPIYNLEVENSCEGVACLIWADEDFNVVTTDEDELILIDNI